jgi:hypothetical protein
MATDESNPPENPSAPDAAEAALLAVSKPATPEDPKKAVIFNCVVLIFTEQGMPAINDDSARIVWSTIAESVLIAIGNGVTDCITEKGFQCPALAPVFSTLREMNQVTVVSDLVTGLSSLVTP